MSIVTLRIQLMKAFPKLKEIHKNNDTSNGEMEDN